jgi:hypothetical protein
MTGHVKRALSAEGVLSLVGLVEARPTNTEPCLGMIRVRDLGPVEAAPSGVMTCREIVTRVGGFAYEKRAVMLDGGRKREESRG